MRVKAIVLAVMPAPIIYGWFMLPSVVPSDMRTLSDVALPLLTLLIGTSTVMSLVYAHKSLAPNQVSGPRLVSIAAKVLSFISAMVVLPIVAIVASILSYKVFG